MKPADAIKLFAHIVGTDRVEAEPGPAAATVLRCGYLPLAIRLVASWLRHHPAKSVSYILERLTGALSPISAAFQLSYRDLNNEQKLMFRRLGLHPGQTFTQQTAAALADMEPDQTQVLLNELYDWHLIEEPLGDRYRFHDLTRDYARRLADSHDPESDREAAINRLLDHYVEAVEHQQDTQNYAWFDDEMPELLSCAYYAAENGKVEYAWRLPRALTIFNFGS